MIERNEANWNVIFGYSYKACRGSTLKLWKKSKWYCKKVGNSKAKMMMSQQ